MTKYECKIMNVKVRGGMLSGNHGVEGIDEELFNEMGADGWYPACPVVSPRSNQPHVCFVRKLENGSVATTKKTVSEPRGLPDSPGGKTPEPKRGPGRPRKNA